MQRVFLKFLMKIPAATFLYSLLVLFAKLSFNLQWLVFAIAIDIVDWIIGEAG